MPSRLSFIQLWGFGGWGSLLFNKTKLITFDTVAFGTALCSAGQAAKDFCSAAGFVSGFPLFPPFASLERTKFTLGLFAFSS